MTSDEERLDRCVASHGLPGAATMWPRRPLMRDEWVGLLVRAQAHRITGALVAAMDDGSLPSHDDQRAEALAGHAMAMRQAVVVEAALLRAMDVLDSVNVDVRVLKGVAVAHLDHPDPADRAFNDVDVLLRRHDVDRAVRALGEAGYARDLPPRTRRWDRRFAKDITVVAPNGVEIDLHRSLAPGAFGFALDLDELWADPEPFALGGRSLQALGTTRRALHAVYSLTAAEATPRLATARDLVWICARPHFDVAGLVAMAQRWRGDGLLSEAVAFVEEELGPDTLPPELGEWAETATQTRWHRSVRGAYRSAGGSNTATLLGGVKGLPWRHRPAYLRGLTLPSRRYRAARRQTPRPPEVRTGLRELTGRSKPS